jgi:hypothetical protein
MNQKIAILAFACCTAAVSTAGGPTGAMPLPPADARQQVLDVEKEWAAAEDKHDATVLRRILDDKFVASFGAMKPYTKEAFIREEMGGAVDPTQTQALSYDAVIIDQDTAVTIGTDTERGTKKGASYTEVARYTAIYVRRHGRWTALAEHIVDVPSAKQR